MIVFEDSSLKWRAQSTKLRQVRVFYCRDLPQNKTQNWTPNDLHAHDIVSLIPLVGADSTLCHFFCGQSACMSLPNLFCDMSNLLFSSYVLLNKKLTLHCRMCVLAGSTKLLSAVQILDKESKHGKFVLCLWISDILHCMGEEKSATAVKTPKCRRRSGLLNDAT